MLSLANNQTLKFAVEKDQKSGIKFGDRCETLFGKFAACLQVSLLPVTDVEIYLFRSCVNGDVITETNIQLFRPLYRTS